MSEELAVRWERDGDGIVTVTLDEPGRSANTMNQRYVAGMAAALDYLEAKKDSITGVIVTSAKKTFFAGGDLDSMIKATPADAPALFEFLGTVKSQLRRLETLGKPVVAAMNGAALGGGLEIGLACHYRIGLDAKGVVYGQPEVSLGLLPGAGGVTRTVRMLGIADAVMNVLIQGQRHKPSKALEVGIIDELGFAQAPPLDTAERRRVADAIVEHLATSARNKGCTRVEVTEPLASAEPPLWKRLGFASRGRTLGREIG